MYPNNIFLTWLSSLLVSFPGLPASAEALLLPGIGLICAGSTLAGYLLYDLVRREFGYAGAYAVWLIYVMHIGLNPWNSIFYSDAVALIFPILLLWIYRNMQEKKLFYWKWFLLGSLSYLGYLIKPQTCIMLIALLGMEVLLWLRQHNRESLCDLVKKLVALGLGMITILLLWNQVVFPSLHITLDPEKQYGPTHFLMMGLNEAGSGGYNQADVDFSASFGTVQDRSIANLKEAAHRVWEMGPVGLARHLTKKTLVNFADGTYAWGQEGSFYRQVFSEKNATLSPLLREIYYNQGKYFPYYATFQQMIWITLLFLGMGCGLDWLFSRKHSMILEASILSLIGLAMFESLFEARARYLYLYAPIFILAAAIGCRGWLQLLRRLFRKEKTI